MSTVQIWWYVFILFLFCFGGVVPNLFFRFEESQNRNIKIILFEIDLLVLAVVICLKILTCAINCVYFF